MERVGIVIVASLALSCLLLGAEARHFGFRGKPDRPAGARCAHSSVTPVRCGARLPPGSLLPHPDDCRLFYVCEWGRAPPSCRQCPANLHFNPVLRVCDWPHAAGCVPSTTQPTAPTDQPQTTLTEAADDASQPTGSTAPADSSETTSSTAPADASESTTEMVTSSTAPADAAETTVGVDTTTDSEVTETTTLPSESTSEYWITQ